MKRKIMILGVVIIIVVFLYNVMKNGLTDF